MVETRVVKKNGWKGAKVEFLDKNNRIIEGTVKRVENFYPVGGGSIQYQEFTIEAESGQHKIKGENITKVL